MQVERPSTKVLDFIPRISSRGRTFWISKRPGIECDRSKFDLQIGEKFDDDGDDTCKFDFLIWIFACSTGSDEKKPVSLERVEELAGKTVNFHNVDISDAEALDKIFKLVSRLKSLFHEFKRSNFHLFFFFFFSVSIWLRHSFGRPEIGWRFLQFAARLLPE